MTSTTTIKSSASKIESAISYQLSAISYQLSAILKFRKGKLGNLFKQGLGKLFFKEPQLRKHGIMVCLTFLMFIASFTKAQQAAWRIGDTEVNFGASTATTTTVGIDPFGSLGYNSMTTPSGKILFYVDNGSVFLGDGTFIGDIMVDFYYNNLLASKKLGGYPEICIVPKPGSCSHYYIIGGYAKYETSTAGTGGTDPDLVFAEIDLEKENPLYPIPNKIGNFVGTIANPKVIAQPVVPVGGTRFGNLSNHTSDIHLAVTRQRADGSRFLFISRGSEIYNATITSTGFSTASLLGTVSNAATGSSIIKSELEVYESSNIVQDGYKLAVPSGTSTSYISLLTVNYNGTSISNQLTLPPFIAAQANPLKGLEFSPNGQYVYATFTDGDYLRCFNSTTGNQVALPLITQSALSDYKYSMIEANADQNFALIRPGVANSTNPYSELGHIVLPNTPSSCTFQTGYAFWPNIWAFLGSSGNFFMGTFYYHANDYSQIAVLPDQIDGGINDPLNPEHDEECCNFYKEFDVKYFTINQNETWAGSNNGINSGYPVVLIKNELRVQAGLTLDVEDIKFIFGLNARLILEPGATLISRGCTFTGSENCFTMWDGIFVQSDVNTGQAANVFMDDDINGRRTIVEHAIYGINVGFKPETIFEIAPGGYINLNHVSFENNMSSILYWGRPLNGLQSIVNNCTFTADYYNGSFGKMWFPLAGQKPSVFISTFNVNVQNITFTGINTFYQAEIAFSITDCENMEINQCHISNCHFGIHINNSGTNGFKSQSQIVGNIFVETGTCVRIENGHNDEIVGNNFNANNGSQEHNFYGIYLDNTSAFHISDNSFNYNRYGVFVINSGKEPSFIDATANGNVFNACWRGVHAYKDNTGLLINCNVFNNNITLSRTGDAYSIGWAIVGQLGDQGNQGFAFNNEFHRFDGFADMGSIQPNSNTGCNPATNFCYFSDLNPLHIPVISLDPYFYFITPSVNLISNGCQFQRLMVLANNNPSIAETLIDQQTDPMLKSIWQNELLHWYEQHNENDSLIAYLINSTDLKEREILFFNYIKEGNYSDASDLLIDFSISNDTDLEEFATLNYITLDLAQNNKSIKEVDSIQLAIIQEYSISDHPIGAQARTMLSQILESMQTLSIPSDTGYTRIGSKIINNDKFTLSPNPANETTVIKLLDPDHEQYTISVADILGKIRFEFIIKNEREISLKELSSGTYLVKLYNKGDLIESHKLIKTK